jgi:hypothetical protein
MSGLSPRPSSGTSSHPAISGTMLFARHPGWCGSMVIGIKILFTFIRTLTALLGNFGILYCY